MPLRSSCAGLPPRMRARVHPTTQTLCPPVGSLHWAESVYRFRVRYPRHSTGARLARRHACARLVDEC
eukprot:487489-Pleurochrysis_carterae.AAC.1